MLLFHILCDTVFASCHKQINVIKSESLKRGSERASVLRFYFTNTGRARGERGAEQSHQRLFSSSPQRQITAWKLCHEHPRLPGSMNADGAFPTTQPGPETGGGAHEMVLGCKSPEKQLLVYKHVCFRSAELAGTASDEGLLIKQVNQTSSQTPLSSAT